MKILVAYFSRTGHTERLAELVREELESRGHEIVVERIEARKRRSKWIILAQQVYTYPLIALALFNGRFKEWWLEHYPQVEEDIAPLSHPDVSGYDFICLGGPKWAEISYPVARYLKEVKGLAGKEMAAFGTFGGPPLPVFELEMLFKPISDRVAKAGGRVAATLGLSSGYHELYVLPLMRLASRMKFKRPLESFHIESEYGKERIREFCDAIEK
jgi:hypothetical protein